MNFKDPNLRIWLLIIGILVIMGWTAYAVVSLVRQTVQQAQQVVAPVSDLSNSMGTQIANVLRPTPTVIVSPVTIIHQVRSLARLETIQYSVERVITAETGQGAFDFLFGDRLLFVAHGEVVAGIDLKKLDLKDMRVVKNVLYVELPEPEVFLATLSNEKSYVYDRERGVLNRGDINLETTARRSAEQAIREAALEDGILELARQNAENYLARFFMDVGKYDEVIFLRPTPAP